MKKQFFLLVTIMILCFTTFAQWQKTNDSTSNVTCFFIEGNKYFAGTDDGSVLTSSDGINWISYHNGLPNIAIRSITTDSSNIYVSIGDWDQIGMGVYFSSDNGVNWTAINNGLPINKSANALVIKDNRIFVAIQDSGIYYSDNSGMNWTLSGFEDKCAFALKLIDTTIFACTYQYGMYFSTDNGQNWTQISNGLPYDAWNSHYYPTYSIATNNGNIFVGTLHGIYISTNNGITWSGVNNGLPKNADSSYCCIGSIAVSDNNIFVSTCSGAYLSNNDGVSWIAINEGFPFLYVYPLAVDDINIYAGVASYGIWKRPLSEFAGIEEINSNEKNINVYPNPATNNLSIESLQKSIMEILNIQGQTILRQSIQQGKTDIDISGLTKGFYILRLNNNDKSVVTKFLKE